MKKINFLVKTLIIIILLNVICPIVALAEEEIQNQLEDIEEYNENNFQEEINDENSDYKNTDEANNDITSENKDNTEENVEDSFKINVENAQDNLLRNSDIINENENKEKELDTETPYKVKYHSHIQDYGWEENFSKKDGEISGTTGKSKRIEAIKISLGDYQKVSSSASIEYQVHVEDYGWMNWKRDGELAGTTGESKRIEAIKIKLVGLDNYSVIYRVHVQDIGWTKWTSDGELAGTTGKSKRIEAIQIQILEEKYKDISFSISDGQNTVNEYIKNNKHYLFVPKNMNISNLTINYEGNIIGTTFGKINTSNKNIVGDFSNTENFIVTSFTGEKENISVIQSDVPALFVNLNNGITQSTLDNGSKDIKYSASLNVYGADNNEYNISDSNIEIKGRGNSTWLDYAKKPYQIKLSSKRNLLGIGNGESKKWVLIANSTDSTLLRNKIMNDLCVNSKLSSIPNCEFADLYINGNYVGNYLICDKIEVGKTRINLKNKSGVIAELDNAYYNEEDYNFQSPYSRDHFVIKEFKEDDADSDTKQEITKEFKNAIENFEKILYADDTKWEEISKLIDVDSFAKYYLITEFAENRDSYYSSTYFYKDGPDDVIHMGPTWDYDGAFGKQKTAARGEYPDVDYTLNYCSNKNYMRRLFLYPEFADAVNKIYENEVKQNLNKINVKEYARKIKQASRINSIVWHSENEYNEWIDYLDNWISKRVNYFNKTYYASKYDANILYVAHTETQGWNEIKKDGNIAGTTGKAKRLEGLKINLGNQINDSVSIKYQAHVQDIGWQDWKQDGEIAGTEGKGKRLEAIRISLQNTDEYSVMYRVHIQDIGWQDWKTDGSLAGTVGQSKRIEAIEIKLVKAPKIEVNYTYNESKNTVIATISSDKKLSSINDCSWKLSEDKLTCTKEYSENNNYKVIVKDIDGIERGLQVKITQVVEPISIVKYSSHIQENGWEKKYSKIDGDISGTTGEEKRLEAIRISLGNSEEISEGASIKYQVHVQNYGWMNWKQDGEIAGTIGESKRIEAIKIKIEGMEGYCVEYRTHIEGSGWQKWKSDGEISGTTGEGKRIEAIQIRVVKKENKIIEPSVEYQAYIQKNGWQGKVSENTISGTTGQSKGIEALKIDLKGVNQEGSIKYKTYVSNSWQDWVNSGELTGTTEQSKNIEAIQIKLDNLEGYSVEYRVHISGYGWQKWRKNGEVAGTMNTGNKIEAIQIRIVYNTSETIEPEVSYQAYVQEDGWHEETVEGFRAGTERQAKRIEALKINLLDNKQNITIKYRAHIQDIGWQSWKSNGAVIGTTGQSKRMEAIQIKLEGTSKYTVEYKVHIQDYGWSDWMIDGETAGTTGQAKRIEAIKIRIVPKYYREYKGIDVSEFNGTINWQSVKNSGVQFAMIRCAYRGYRNPRIVMDSKFDENIRNASAFGIKVGIYFFSQATSISEAVEEANYAVSLARKYGCVTYPIAIDSEASGADNYDGRADVISTALRTNVVAAFCNQVRSCGYEPMVYASRDWLYNNLEVNRLLNYETWLAHYTGTPNITSNYRYNYTMWQYTSSGSVPGINGNVDLNIGYKRY